MALLICIPLHLAQAAMYRGENLSTNTCVHHISSYNYYKESYNLSHIDKLYDMVLNISEQGLLNDGTKDALMNMLTQATHGLCVIGEDSRKERQASFVALVLGVIGTWILSPSLGALLNMNTATDGGEWGNYLTQQTNKAIDMVNLRIGALEDRVSADEKVIMIMAILSAERNQLEDARGARGALLRRMLGHAELRYLQLNDSKVDFNDYQAGLEGLVNLLGGFAIPEEGYRLTVRGKRGNKGNCSESIITFEASSPLPSEACETINRVNSESTITNTGDGRLRYLGPLAIAFKVSEDKWMIPTESIIADDFPEKKNLSLHVVGGSLMVSPIDTGQVMAVCNGSPYLHIAYPNRTYSKTATCSGYFGSPKVRQNSPWAAGVGIKRPNGSLIGIYLIEEKNTIIYKPRVTRWASTVRPPIPHINTTEQSKDITVKGISLTLANMLAPAACGVSTLVMISVIILFMKRKRRRARYMVNMRHSPVVVSMSPLPTRAVRPAGVSPGTCSMDHFYECDNACEGRAGLGRMNCECEGNDESGRMNCDCEGMEEVVMGNLVMNDSMEHHYEDPDAWGGGEEAGNRSGTGITDGDSWKNVDKFYECIDTYLVMGATKDSKKDIRGLHRGNMQSALHDITAFNKNSLKKTGFGDTKN